jgi:hypothetical protein
MKKPDTTHEAWHPVFVFDRRPQTDDAFTDAAVCYIPRR